jgi:hypothetical protein
VPIYLARLGKTACSSVWQVTEPLNEKYAIAIPEQVILKKSIYSAVIFFAASLTYFYIDT